MKSNENEKKFNKLFDKVMKIGFMNLMKEEQSEYFRLQKILVDDESKRTFEKILESGDYRS